MASSDNDPAKAPWSTIEMLLAAVNDEQRYMRYLYTCAHSEKKPGEPPKPMPRPGVSAQGSRSKMTDTQRAILDPRMRANLRAVPDPDDPPPSGPVGVTIG
jgi:hypothetical protein